jgi:magnesium-transporting ATPase (P-type)
MMTIVVQTFDNRVFVFTKGADTSVEPLLTNLDEKDRMTLDNIDDFANEGLRTLVYAFKELNFLKAKRVSTMKDAELESDLSLLGVTAVEDLLQDNVAKCIEDFREADIKVWILTGDKGATARQIGLSCGVLSLERPIVEIQSVHELSDEMDLGSKKDVLIEGICLA